MLAFVNATSQIIIKIMAHVSDYYSPEALFANLGGTLITYFSKPGLPEWDSIPPAVHLLANHAQPRPQDRVWCVNCGTGALAVAIVKMVPRGSCSLITYDTLAITCARLTFAENNLDNLRIISDIDLSNPELGQPDLVLLNIYKGRNLNRRILLHTWKALKPGGRLLVSGANNQGVQSTFKDASHLFQNISVLAYKKGNRVAKYIKETHRKIDLPDWTSEPGIAPGTWQTFHVDTGGFSFDLVSLPGVFSYANLDSGTALLLSTIDDLSGKKVLDVGCGSGIIGLFSAARNAQIVDMVDSQLLAVASSRENITRNQYPICHAFCSDLLAAVEGRSYDYILSNPPFHAGIRVDYQAAHALITSAGSVLEPGGHLQLVANRFIPYDRLMSEGFGNVKTLAQTSTYRILASMKKHA
jgi:16S rRNA (guanine1207-N2)-methyltransferase